MKNNKIKLQYLIISVVLLAFMLTSLVSIWSGYKLNKQYLGESALETNKVYAQKLADTATNYINEQTKLLTANAPDIVNNLDNQRYLEQRSDLILSETSAFNSIAIVNNKARVLATSPQSLDLIGVKLTSQAMKMALKEKKVMISQPYESIKGRLIVFISVPLFSKEDEYLGLIGGTIYLKEKNVLSDLLGKHPYKDKSSVYVVDKSGIVIYDENSENIGEDVSKFPLIKHVLKAQNTGKVQAQNTDGNQSFAGYSDVDNADWMVISQRPADAVEAPASKMVEKMLHVALPLLLLSLIIVLIAASRIAKPLQKLAELTESSKSKNEIKNFENVPAWYYEVIQLKSSLIKSFGFLHNQVHDLTGQTKTDALTGLLNRRSIDEFLNSWTKNEAIFSIILVDADHFKRVNDTFGHDVGDEVLKFLAQTLEKHARPEDLCCRFGGEEFVILLPLATEQEAFEIAENIRKNLEQTISPSGEYISVSAGVAECRKETPNELIKRVDSALYESKNNGRNRVTRAK